MDWEDLEPGEKPVRQRDLEALGIEELRQYVVRLHEEIARAEAAITAKQNIKSGALALFRK